MKTVGKCRVRSLHSTPVPPIALRSGSKRHRWMLMHNPLLSWAECRLGNDFYGSLLLAPRCIMFRDWMAVKHSSGYCHHIFNSILHYTVFIIDSDIRPSSHINASPETETFLVIRKLSWQHGLGWQFFWMRDAKFGNFASPRSLKISIDQYC